ncbi:hypothetical protein T492DRAFT_837608 [Pavlovales sp. CCMP2436]|nr:hypothetical protein T492DRAFT_837608 [Pavlovales sp. CCMP2436]
MTPFGLFRALEATSPLRARTQKAPKGVIFERAGFPSYSSTSAPHAHILYIRDIGYGRAHRDIGHKRAPPWPHQPPKSQKPKAKSQKPPRERPPRNHEKPPENQPPGGGSISPGLAPPLFVGLPGSTWIYRDLPRPDEPNSCFASAGQALIELLRGRHLDLPRPTETR